MLESSEANCINTNACCITNPTNFYLEGGRCNPVVDGLPEIKF